MCVLLGALAISWEIECNAIDEFLLKKWEIYSIPNYRAFLECALPFALRKCGQNALIA